MCIQQVSPSYFWSHTFFTIRSFYTTRGLNPCCFFTPRIKLASRKVLPQFTEPPSLINTHTLSRMLIQTDLIPRLTQKKRRATKNTVSCDHLVVSNVFMFSRSTKKTLLCLCHFSSLPFEGFGQQFAHTSRLQRLRRSGVQDSRSFTSSEGRDP